MQIRKPLPRAEAQSSQSGQREHEIWPRRHDLFQWVGRLVLGAILIAGSAMILAPSLSELPVESPRTDAVGGHVKTIQAGAFSPDGRFFATCGLDQSVRLWDASRSSESRVTAPVILADDTVKYAVAFSADGSLLGAVGPGSLAIWSARFGQFEVVARTSTGASSCLAFSPDGQTLAVGSDDGEVTLHGVPEARVRAVLRAHSNAVRSLSFSPDGRYLVSAGQDALVVLWDATRGIKARTLISSSSNPSHVVAFSPDSRSVAVGEGGARPVDVLLIDAATGAVRARLAGHDQGVCALAFSPDGRTLATASADQSVKLWNLALAREMISFSNESGSVNSLSFSRDGDWLAFGGDGASIKAPDGVRPHSPRLGFLPLPETEGMAVTIDGPHGEALPSGYRLPRVHSQWMREPSSSL